MKGTLALPLGLGLCLLPFASAAPAALLIDEGFNNFEFGVRPDGWIFTNCNANSDVYTSAAYYGYGRPALMLDDTGDSAASAAFSAGSGLELKFWYRGDSTDATSNLLVEQKYAGSWNSLTSLSSLPPSGTESPFIPLSASASGVKFSYTKSFGKLALDDVRIISRRYMRVTYLSWTLQGSTGAYGDAVYYEFPGEDGLLDTPDDKNLLFDGGYSTSPSEALGQFLDSKIGAGGTIHYMVLSSPGADHIYGLVMAVKRYNVLNYYENVRWNPGVKGDYDSFIADLNADEGGCNVYYYNAGHYLSGPSTNLGPGWDPYIRARVLAAKTEPGSVSEDNPWAGVIQIRCGDSVFLQGGDANDSTGEQWILDNNTTYSYSGARTDLADTDFYKVHHHGSDGASGANFLNQMSPQYAVVTVAHSSANHPTAGALDRINDAGGVSYRVDLDHHVTVRCDNLDNYEITRSMCWSRQTDILYGGSGGYYASGELHFPPPPLVANLRAVEETKERVVVAWDACTTPSTAYNVYRSLTHDGDSGAGTAREPGMADATGIYQKLTASAIAYTSYTDVQGQPGTTYYYRVASLQTNTDGASSVTYERRWSNEVAARRTNFSPTPTPIGYRTPTPTPTPSPSATPSPSPSPSSSPSPTPTPSPSPSPSSTPSPTPEGYHTPTPTPSPSSSPTASPSPSASPTSSPTPTPEGYLTPTPTPSPAPSPSPTPVGFICFVSLGYSTYLGGGNPSDAAYAIALGPEGEAYVTGTTLSTAFPTLNPYQSTQSAIPASQDVFLAAVSSSGSSLVFSTYLGGTREESGRAIRLDSELCPYLAGDTWSNDFPTIDPLQASLNNALGSYMDAFAVKFSSSGSSLVFSTYLGGVNQDQALAIEVDGERRIVLGGFTRSSNFPTQNPYQPSLAGSTASDAFAARLSSSGSSLEFSTFIGGSLNDQANGLAVDATGNVYLGGYAVSANFPTRNAFQSSRAGSTYDAFVTALNSSGSQLIYSSYLGGSDSDIGYSFALDCLGRAYLAGHTASPDFPLVQPYQSSRSGTGTDAFVAQISSSGTSLLYSTYLGGAGSDSGYAIACDSSDGFYLSGRTASSDFPTLCAYQASSAGGYDAFVAHMAGPALIFSTFLGGSAGDEGKGVAAGATDCYVAGQTYSSNFPTVSAYQASWGGTEAATDGFVSKLALICYQITPTPVGYHTPSPTPAPSPSATRSPSPTPSPSASPSPSITPTPEGYKSPPPSPSATPTATSTPTPVPTFTPTPPVCDTDMIAYWKADGDTVDSAGDHDGTLSGASYTSGKVDQAFACQSGAYVRIPSSTAFDFGSTSFSMCAWIKTDQIQQPAYGTIFARTELGWPAYPPYFAAYDCHVDGHYFGVMLRDDLNGFGQLDIRGTKDVTDNNWHFVVGTVDRAKTEVRAYVDGALDDSGSLAETGAMTFTADESVGCTLNPNAGYFFRGAIDELAVYRRALSETEILDLYQSSYHYCETTPSPGPSATPTAEPTKTPTPEPSPTPSPTPVSPSPSVTPTPEPTATPSPSATPITPTPTAAPSPSPSPTPITPTPTATPSPSPSPTPITPTPTATPSPSPSPTIITPTPSASPTPSVRPSASATPSPSVTPSRTPTPSPTPTCGPSIAPQREVIQSGDYDGDAAADPAIFRPTGGLWSIRGITRLYFGNSTDQTAPGDYDGDGTADIAVYRAATGLWSIAGLSRAYFGGLSDRAVPADYDGDGSCDVGIFRENGGIWSIRFLTRFYFGATGDWPIPGDYTGDGTAEGGLYRVSSGQWLIYGLTRFYFGSSSDWPVPGNYAGAGSRSFGIFRPCSGMWGLRDLTRLYFGNCFDYPRPGDFNADGTDDLAIFRESTGMWSARNLTRVYFGGTGDIPVTR